MIGVSFDIAPQTLGELRRLESAGKRWGFTMKDITANQSALLASDLIKMTPPFTKPGKPSEKVGRKAIRSDLLNIATIISNDEFASAFDWVASSGVQSKAWKTKRGAVIGTETTHWVEDPTQFAPIHQKARSKNTGRVSRAGSWDRKIGRSVFIDRAVMTGSTFGQYLESVYKRIGSLAAHWVPVANYFRAKSTIPVKWSIPSFISRHIGNGRGVDAMSLTGNGYMKGSMTMRFGNSAKMQGLYAVSARKRQRDMAGFVEKRLERFARELGRAA